MRTIIAAFTIVNAVGVLWCAPAARAAFTHLSVETYQVTVGGVERTQHRLWANFSTVTEAVSSWGAIGTNLTIQNIQANGELSVNGFLNAGGNGDLPPPPNHPDPDVIYDSYYTIQVTSWAGDPIYPILMVGMPPILDGAVTLSAMQDTAAITVTPDSPWLLPPPVLLMQALVTSGEHIRGTIGINTIGSPEAVIVATFNSVPGPGALMVLAMAGMCGARRRR